MRYTNTISGVFVDRPNRFVAHVETKGGIETVHVKNTGRCRELLLPGVELTLAVSDNPSRKTKYDLVSVYKKGLGWVNIDSQAPNVVVREWLESGPRMFPNITMLKPEYTYGNSRVDFYLECGRCQRDVHGIRRLSHAGGDAGGTSPRRIFIEVKGCTLELDGIGYFPDAPTERGVKHLHELTKAVADGYECFIAFVIALPGVTKVLPNRTTHPEFGEALDAAVQAGVRILPLPCDVTPDSLAIRGNGRGSR